MWLLLYEYLWECERRKTVSHIRLNRKAVHYSLRQVLCVPVSWITPTTGIKVKQMSNKSNSLNTKHLIKTWFHWLPLFFSYCLFLSMHVIVQESFKSHFHTHSCTFCTKELHKGVYVHSLHVVLCLYTHLHLFSWYSQCTLFWWGCRCMWWVVLCLCVKNITRAFRCYLYSFQLSRQEARLISLVSCPLKSRMHCVLQDLSFLSLALLQHSFFCILWFEILFATCNSDSGLLTYS